MYRYQINGQDRSTPHLSVARRGRHVWVQCLRHGWVKGEVCRKCQRQRRK